MHEKRQSSDFHTEMNQTLELSKYFKVIITKMNEQLQILLNQVKKTRKFSKEKEVIKLKNQIDIIELIHN